MGTVFEHIQMVEAAAIQLIKETTERHVRDTLERGKGIPPADFRIWFNNFDNQLEKDLSRLAFILLGKEFLTKPEKRQVSSKVKKDSISLDFLIWAFALGVIYVKGRYRRIDEVPLTQVKEFVEGYNAWSRDYKELLRNHRGMYLLDLEKTFASMKANVRDAARRAINEYAGYPIITAADWVGQYEIFNLMLYEYLEGWGISVSASTQYRSQQTLNTTIASASIEEYGAANTQVYFEVRPDACNACVSAYLSNGRHSSPKIFSLSELLINGGKEQHKRDQLLPVVVALHPIFRGIMRIDEDTVSSKMVS